MASTDEESKSEAGEETAAKQSRALESPRTEVSFDGGTPAQLGIARYVHAAFFAAGVLVAYLSGKLLGSIWNGLAEWPAAVRAIPQLVVYAEDDRPSFTMPIGALIGIAVVVYLVRRADVRRWADEVATELYKVHWPEREIVQNGTITVLVAGLFATVYIGLLDRVWAFLTNLVYGV
jgi:preprotein translocase subunit SecE